MQPAIPTTCALNSNAVTLALPQTNNHPSENILTNLNASFSPIVTSANDLYEEISVKFLPDYQTINIWILPTDAINQIFAKITQDKDLCAFTLTCTTLSKMSLFPEIQTRIHRFKITCQFDRQLDEKTTQLILAIEKRSLWPSESYATGIPLTIYSNYAQQRLDTEHKHSAEQAEKEFYKLFIKRCEKLNINSNSNEFIISAHAFNNNLQKKSKTLNIPNETINIKLKTVCANFNSNIFNSLVEAYANQPIAKITPYSFKQNVAKLKKLTPTNDIVNIEATLRMVITRTPVNIVAIRELAAEYLDAFSPKIEELKQILKVELDASKTEAGMTDEQILEINTKLGDLEATAQREAQKLNLFLTEILQVVQLGQEAARSAALHNIIG